MYDFWKNFIFLRINPFFSKIKLFYYIMNTEQTSKNIFMYIQLFIQNKYMHPLSKNLILLKETSLCKKTHSV